MVTVITVRFREGGKEYYFDPCGFSVDPGAKVIIETARGLEFGICTQGNAQVEENLVVQPLRPMVRFATEEDCRVVEHNREREVSALDICREKVAEHGLDMRLISCECPFEGNKVLFYFTSEGRVDFRALVRDLASVFHARIELRQIGVRDESKILGGLGICGRPLCCSTFLNEFQPVSIKMAKTQGLSLNPTKISGACGRLMCCLKYEQDAYEDAMKRIPKMESFVETPDGPGNVCQLDYLREKVVVRLEEPDSPHRSYDPDELRVIRNGKGRRPEGYVAPPPEELEKLRKTSPAPVFPDKPALSGSIDAALSELSYAPQEEKRPPEVTLSQQERPQTSQRGQDAPQRSSSHSHRRRRRGGGRSKGGPAPSTPEKA